MICVALHFKRDSAADRSQLSSNKSYARHKLSHMIHMFGQFPMTYDWYMPVCTIYMTPCRIK